MTSQLVVQEPQCFLTLDAERAFYHIQSDKKSSRLLTFNTPLWEVSLPGDANGD